MLWVFIGLLGGFAFVFLTRLFWAEAPAPVDQSADQPSDSKAAPRRPLVTLAIVILVVALVMMIATGRLHWLSAVITGVIPFLRRITGLLRYAPILNTVLGYDMQNRLKGLFGNSAQRTGERPTSQQPTTAGALSVSQARQILEVANDASKADIVAAHRHLMARNHPDRGGSNYIATQLNTARDLLLENL